MTKQIKITIASIIFLLVVIIDVYAVIIRDKSLEMIFKPLLMTTLVIVYLLSVKKPNFWLVSALFFSFWGDVFLLDKTNYFVFGLASFLIAHVLYVKMISKFLAKKSIVKILKAAVIFVLLFLGVLYLIKDNLGEMLVPVIVYGIAISGFGTCALLNYQQEKSLANLWLWLGAILFIVSDSLIALNNFYSPMYFLDFLIVVLYIVSQYFICKALILK
ncbi:lysoplasmalogenase [Tenacibaculum sp. AHE15PA]|uniref:lysoplasmalogenase n=1 Tax=unclassified Tenacibaculum TaxID=2635139 RepID=UPI001C4EF5F6|nr:MULTISPECIES: lysoplasmalogenase [unclassified Tenacibaculum]QXP74101.1 lysoplasmalogenase [Tenacibaculum sp. AHE14PA]QXP75531.1 lysoplasmalogenase [Tenacibaculum sp. AHE15PA]